MTSRAVRLVLTTIALFSCLPASADSTATIRVHNFGYRLIDLNPGDGLAPSIQFRQTADDTSLYVALADERPSPPLALQQTIRETDRAADMAYAYTSETNNASAQISPRTGPETVEIELAAMSRGSAQSSASNSVSVRTGPMAFDLGPMTAVIFTALVDYRTETTFPAYANERAGAGATLLSTMDSGGLIDGDSYGYRFDFERGPRVYDGHGTLFLTQVNSWQQSAGGNIWLQATAETISMAAAPVPEPGHWSMLLAGLALLATARRRHRIGIGRAFGRCLLAAPLLMTAHAATAQTAVSARVHAFSYTLIDLDATDGIAPKLTFFGSGVNRYSGALGDNSVNPPVSSYWNETSTLVGLPLDKTYGSPALEGRMQLGARTNFTAIDDTLVLALDYRPGEQNGIGMAYDTSLYYALSPNTAVLFSAAFEGRVSFGGQETAEQVGLTAMLRAQASEYAWNESTLLGTSYQNLFTPGAREVDWLLFSSATNRGGGTQNMTLNFGVSVAGNVSPVPEPDPVWMLLGGLGLLGGLTRSAAARSASRA